MKIASRISLLFLPLLVVPIVAVSLFSSQSARVGIDAIARELLYFKSDQLIRYADSQHQLLVANGLADREEFVAAAVSSVEDFAAGLMTSPTELLFALDGSNELVMATRELSADELDGVRVSPSDGLVDLAIGGERRVASVRAFAPMDWTVVVSETESAFFGPVSTIIVRSAIVTLVAIALAAAMIVWFSRLITEPIGSIASAMANLVENADFSQRVELPHQDEVGDLSRRFNVMAEALEEAYQEIEGYAVSAATVRLREMKIRRVFQKYVPREVVEQFFASPEAMLTGENRSLAVVFTDIRGFTSLSESLSSHDLVNRLNRYFSRMVSVITEQHGVVDKYMGDGIMAFFGAPVPDEQSCDHAAHASIAMLEALDELNQSSDSAIRIGIGIGFGEVTVGNIGSEQKMDYTVVGDVVNVASRLEGLTKTYGVPILITDTTRAQLSDTYHSRLVDLVKVKGRNTPLDVFTVGSGLSETELSLWRKHDELVQRYRDREFDAAYEGFRELLEKHPHDPLLTLYRDRADHLREHPPGDDWDPVVEYEHK